LACGFRLLASWMLRWLFAAFTPPHLPNQIQLPTPNLPLVFPLSSLLHHTSQTPLKHAHTHTSHTHAHARALTPFPTFLQAWRERSACAVELRRVRLALKGRKAMEPTPCPNGCGERLPRKQMRFHCAYHCARRQVSCWACGEANIAYTVGSTQQKAKRAPSSFVFARLRRLLPPPSRP